MTTATHTDHADTERAVIPETSETSQTSQTSQTPDTASAEPQLNKGSGDSDPRVIRSRTLLINTAIELLTESGVESVTIDALTKASGVARATLYRHFASRDELLAAAFENLLPPAAVVTDTENLRQWLLELMTEQAKLLNGAPLHAALLAWAAMNPPSDDEARSPDDQPQLHRLRRRIVDIYLKPSKPSSPATPPEPRSAASSTRVQHSHNSRGHWCSTS